MLLILLLAPVFGYGVAAGEEEIVVFVAASLTDAVKEVKERFEARSGARVSLNPGASGTLLHQIEAGALADVFISASTKEVDALELDGLALPDTRRELLTNKLVVVASAGSGLEINSARDLAGREVKRIAIGEPESVPVGRYAREALINLGLWDSLY
ncbi:MAG: molybdate ABC transporter substrate-binding protein, partial [Candidatus Brocadiales bacterium]|nr:molybdate ABC transporter substrate-binding protein [Candidatus Brocadiales bacterium]